MNEFSVYLVLGILSLALFISLSLHIIFCLRRRAAVCTDADRCCFGHISERETQSQMERQNFRNLSHREQEENPCNHREQQENPIYGNISTDRSEAAEDCYEMMTMQRNRDLRKPSEADLNYASLDLKVAMKRKKKHGHLQGQMQGHSTLQEHLPDRLTPPPNAFLELDAEADAHLPPRETCTMVSHSSIYLNSQQIDQEAEEMERGWSAITEMEKGSREGHQWGEDSRSRDWKIEQDSGEGTDSKPYGSNGNICVLLSEDDT
ncbi:hypothetical protein OJAV_G00140950 [Oryzias javanicus]|uniref:Uncharacterized protein n=1 Tax=Oryzias javanicus TaxID=123683 RepID=A0A3S2PDH8_ORYJA|nr:hypothetical protein OJAV_G00140950 [Oryzias javanicus]